MNARRGVFIQKTSEYDCQYFYYTFHDLLGKITPLRSLKLLGERSLYLDTDLLVVQYPGGGGVLPSMGSIGMCRCEGYGFQDAYSGIGI